MDQDNLSPDRPTPRGVLSYRAADADRTDRGQDAWSRVRYVAWVAAGFVLSAGLTAGLVFLVMIANLDSDMVDSGIFTLLVVAAALGGAVLLFVTYRQRWPAFGIGMLLGVGVTGLVEGICMANSF